jgi:hypothetical protein
MVAALCFTVALLVTTAYFVMGSIPLLVLKHDTPVDARFVRSFFNIYYVAAIATASATAVSFGCAGRPGLATGALALACVALWLRRRLIPKMDALGVQMESSPGRAIAAFRKTHAMAVFINVIQLVIIVSSLGSLSK